MSPSPAASARDRFSGGRACRALWAEVDALLARLAGGNPGADRTIPGDGRFRR